MKFKVDYQRMGMQSRSSNTKWYTAKVGELITIVVYSVGSYWAYDIHFHGGKNCSQLVGKLFGTRDLAQEGAIDFAKGLLAKAQEELESEVEE